MGEVIRYQQTSRTSQEIETTSLPLVGVMFLGARASGKTSYFSVMTHELELDHPTRQFNLVLGGAQARTQLTSYYDMLVTAHTFLELTDPNNAVDRLRYRLIPRTLNTSIEPLFSIEFLDYSGERMRRSILTPEAEWEIEQSINDAEVLVVLIDGEIVADLLRKGRAPAEELAMAFEQDLNLLLTKVASSGSLVPVHFMLTKWDVCLQMNVSLADVRTFLQANGAFRNCVESRQQFGIPVRLVPVSSFGTKFLKPTNPIERLMGRGKQKIAANARPAPINVEVPFALAFIDKMRALQRAAQMTAQSLIVPDSTSAQLTARERFQLFTAKATRFTTKNAETILKVVGVAANLWMQSNGGGYGSPVSRPSSPSQALQRSNSQRTLEALTSSANVMGMSLLPEEAKDKFAQWGERVARATEDQVHSSREARQRQHQEDLSEFERLMDLSRVAYARYQEGVRICSAIVAEFTRQYPESVLAGSDPGGTE